MKVKDKEFEILISKNEIDSITSNLANQINLDFKDKEPLFIIMMNGAFIFASDLLRKISGSCEIELIRYSSYRGTTSLGEAKSHNLIPSKVFERNIIIIEDIIDTGITMDTFLSDLNKNNPKSISIISLLTKPDAFQKDIFIKYVGKQIENKFVVGYHKYHLFFYKQH